MEKNAPDLKADDKVDLPSSSTAEVPIISPKPLRIAMVAGEASGDILGAGLIESIRKRYPNAVFEGIGGPLMIEQGFHSFYPMERLSVMGLFEVLGRLFEIIGIRRSLKRLFLNRRPDIFIGIDAPDFNLGLEAALRKRGIKTGHYVSPSVWAWRQKRVYKIARAVDLMMTLFPFEARFYRDHKIAVRFVGHPLADLIPLHPDKSAARKNLGIAHEAQVVALLPGSRSGEISYIGETFLQSALWLHERRKDIEFVVPCINEARKDQISQLIQEVAPELPIRLLLGRSREVMAASDAILLASGTATLEGMLMKRPMVVAYRVSKLTHFVMKRLLKAPFISLPNLLAGREVVPELIQDDAQPERIGERLLLQLQKSSAEKIEQVFSGLHVELQQDASEQAAEAVTELLQKQVERG